MGEWNFLMQFYFYFWLKTYFGSILIHIMFDDFLILIHQSINFSDDNMTNESFDKLSCLLIFLENWNTSNTYLHAKKANYLVHYL